MKWDRAGQARSMQAATCAGARRQAHAARHTFLPSPCCLCCANPALQLHRDVKRLKAVILRDEERVDAVLLAAMLSERG